MAYQVNALPPSSKGFSNESQVLKELKEKLNELTVVEALSLRKEAEERIFSILQELGGKLAPSGLWVKGICMAESSPHNPGKKWKRIDIELGVPKV